MLRDTLHNNIVPGILAWLGGWPGLVSGILAISSTTARCRVCCILIYESLKWPSICGNYVSVRFFCPHSLCVSPLDRDPTRDSDWLLGDGAFLF